MTANVGRSGGPVPGQRLSPAATTGLTAIPGLPPLGSMETPDLDLGDLEDLSGALRVPQNAGVL